MDSQTTHGEQSTGIDTVEEGLRKTLYLCYALYGLSYVFGGLPAIVAIIINYIKRRDAEKYPLLAAHFTWQKNTFWAGLVIGIVGLFTFFLLIGFPIIIGGGVWMLYRSIKGWIFLAEGKQLYPTS